MKMTETSRQVMMKRLFTDEYLGPDYKNKKILIIFAENLKSWIRYRKTLSKTEQATDCRGLSS